MLVITRRNNEELIIGGDIRVRVVDIRGHRVKLGIEAPLSVSVRRCDPPRTEFWVDAEEAVPLKAR